MTIRSASEILRHAVIKGDPERIRRIEDHEAAMEIATQLYELRNAAGLSRKDLARLAGTSQAAVTRLEDANYEGHSLQLLRRIAWALGRRVEVRFVPAEPTTS